MADTINFSRNNGSSSNMTELRSPLLNQSENGISEGINEDDISVNTDDTNEESAATHWQLNYQEAAIYLKEGENNEHFTTHPKNQDALPAYILVHNVWFYLMDFTAAFLLLGLALCENPAVPVFQLPEIIHGSLELFLLTITAIGLGLKVRWLGIKKFITHKRTLFKTIVLLVMYCEAITVLVRQKSHFRITRSFRPFFLIDCHYCGGVRRVLRQIFQSLLPILDVMLLLFYFMVIFSILGFFIFANIDKNFDSLIDSFISLFILMTTANFPDVMMPAYNKSGWSVLFFIVFLILQLYFLMNLLLAVVYDTFTGIEKAKFKALHLHKRTAASKAFKFLCSRRHPGKVSFNHFQGLMKFYRPRYSKRDVLLAFKTLNTTDTELLSMSEFQDIYDVVQLRWKLKRDDNKVWFDALMSPFNKPFKLLHRFVTGDIFNYFIYMVLFGNGIVFIYKTIIISNSDARTIDEDLLQVSWYDWTFMGIYGAEIILKVIGLGVTGYLNSGWNVFDFVVTVIAVLGIAVESLNSAFYYLVILRPIRLLRLFKIKKRYRDVFGTFYVLLGRMLSVGIVLVVMYYFYAIIGMECFSDVELMNCCKNTSFEGFFSNSSSYYFYLNNFSNILYSYVTLFELTVVNNWHVIMFGFAYTTTQWSRIYFILFYLSSLVVVTIIVTFILEAFVFRMQYGLKNPQADDEFVSSIETEMTISLQELERFYSSELRKDVGLAVQQTLLRNLSDRMATYKGSRKRTKADLSKTMYADEIKEWIKEQDKTHRKELRQFLVRQLSRSASQRSLPVVPEILSSDDDSGQDMSEDDPISHQLQTFPVENPAVSNDYQQNESELPYWEIEEEINRVKQAEGRLHPNVKIRYDVSLETRNNCQLRPESDDEDDDQLIAL
ncbi:two pore channel protein 1-like isoform X1 [Asterias amurensis]|uniref:two pore channel protein 1-like isoform X1 n=1 Tax=Asterias amurensis TaxID=7602 RepID=UPI003AB18A7E